MKNLKEIVTFFAGGLVGFVSALAISNYSNNFLPKEVDVNDDGRPDIVLREASKKQDALIFIQRKDGKYDACNMTIQCGYPFFPTLDGKRTYGWDGQVFENNK